MSDVLAAAASRRSHSRVTDAAPNHQDLLPLVAAAGRVADHGSLQPWRIIEVRADARIRLGEAFVAAAGGDPASSAKLAAKPLRAPLLLAIVAVHRPSEKVERWEQEAMAAGVAHTLSLLLNEAGWGVMWRTGHLTRTEPVSRMHCLADNERLLGWLYVGGVPDSGRGGSRKTVDAEHFLSTLA